MVGVGLRIGNYRVLRKLGQGGMGAVFEAVHEEIGRRAAIKVLLPDYAKDPQNIARFFNEARAVNVINHPGLVGVFESGRLEDGAGYIVMEYLAGELLANRLEKIGALGVRATLNISRQIASALAAAHSKSIIHREFEIGRARRRVRVRSFRSGGLRSVLCGNPKQPSYALLRKVRESTTGAQPTIAPTQTLVAVSQRRFGQQPEPPQVWPSLRH